ncbi:hypothetical protein Hypma_012515 [Hypsizygus marmoreus]|uniref:Uncharacterized protein n=1 Tax=Hypsizygus marmoreus TaxID=39966 RepID=A0A369JEU0_HYPMA|nr:hypothetical protein Hypma_012515 [Hypsizygus marmoreus]
MATTSIRPSHQFPITIVKEIHSRRTYSSAHLLTRPEKCVASDIENERNDGTQRMAARSVQDKQEFPNILYFNTSYQARVKNQLANHNPRAVTATHQHCASHSWWATAVADASKHPK